MKQHHCTIRTLSPTQSLMSAAFIRNKVWKNGDTIKIAFLGGSANQQKTVMDAANEWLQYANLEFQWNVPAAQSDVRISFDPNGGNWSYLGKDARGANKNEPSMNLAEMVPGTIKHEFGHMLGMIHEHQNPQGGIQWNKEAVYQELAGPPNNWDRGMVDNNLFGKYSTSQLNGTQYDSKSIMHYPVKPEWTTNGHSVPWNNALSAQDKAHISKIYPFANGGDRNGNDTGGGSTGGTSGGGGTTTTMNSNLTGFPWWVYVMALIFLYIVAEKKTSKE